MRHYHPTECIIDLLAASGPQELSAMRQECYAQCTTHEWSDAVTAQTRSDGLSDSVRELIGAGLIELDTELADRGFRVYELTDYGYAMLDTRNTPSFKANAANRIY